MKLSLALLSLAFSMTPAHSPYALAQGRTVIDTLRSVALAGNRTGDTPDRQITIRLPPGYDRDPSRRYPVVYLLHGFTSDPVEWFDGTYQGLDIGRSLDQLAATGGAEYIMVMPLANNSYGGSFYVNSAAFGRWEDFIVEELVPFIDARFRTLPAPESRGLAGQSMGGFGALHLAGRHSDTFGHVYAMSPCCLAFVGEMAPESDAWRSQPEWWLRAMATAFAPESAGNPADASIPVPFAPDRTGRLHEVDAVISAWREAMPLYRLERDPASYRHICSIALEAGREDEIANVTLGASAFARALNRAGIPHTHVEFTGGHIDRTRERFEQAVLPFFARVLRTQDGPGACRAP